MQHRPSLATLLLLPLLGAAASCDFSEYTTLTPVIDAGTGAAGSGSAGAAGEAADASSSSTGNGNDRSNSNSSNASSNGPPLGSEAPDAAAVGTCTGCVRLAGPGGFADYQLQFGTTWNLSSTVISWRFRVRNFAGTVSVVPYAQSGDRFEDEARLAIQDFTAASDWQELVLDLGGVDGGTAAAGVEFGPSFDKTRVRRVGIAFQVREAPRAAAALLELDGVTFSNNPALNTDFAAGPAGFLLVDSPGVSVTHVPE